VRILIVSQMYPGADAPDLGTFVAQVERALVERGHDVDRAVLDTRAGGKLRYLALARRTLAARRPDVVYAHFLVPSGLIAALGTRAPLVVTANGRGARQDGGRLERRRPRALRRRAAAERAAALPLHRRARGAQERRAPRGRLRAARRRDAHLRGRRPAPRRARRTRASAPARARAARRRAAARRREPRRLPAEPDRAARTGAPRGHGGRALRRRDAPRRTARVRPAGGWSARRPARRRRARARARAGGCAAASERGRTSCGRRPRRAPAGRADRGDPQPGGRSRSASLSSTSGRTVASSPASCATARACSQLSRTFSGATPCFSLLSPVTSSFWMRSRASAPFTSSR